MELVEFQIKVKPLWFTGNRVYQFHTEIVAKHGGIEDMSRYFCKIKIDGELKLVLTFDLVESIEDIMPAILKVQTNPAMFNGAFTGKSHCPTLHHDHHCSLRVTPLLLCRLRSATGMDSVSRSYAQEAPRGDARRLGTDSFR